MGAKNKGGVRITATTRAKQVTQSLTSSIFKGGMEHTIVQLALAGLPHYALIIFAAYTLFKYGRIALQVYREYKELRQTVSENRALTVEAERTGVRQLTDAEGDEQLDKYIRTKVAHLLAEREASQMIQKALPNSTSTETKERFRLMLQKTLSEFLIGAARGGKGKLVDEVARQFFR